MPNLNANGAVLTPEIIRHILNAMKLLDFSPDCAKCCPDMAAEWESLGVAVTSIPTVEVGPRGIGGLLLEESLAMPDGEIEFTSNGLTVGSITNIAYRDRSSECLKTQF